MDISGQKAISYLAKALFKGDKPTTKKEMQKKTMIWFNWVITIIPRVFQFGTVYITEHP